MKNQQNYEFLLKNNMKSLFKLIFSGIFITLILLNIWVFTKGMHLSSDINNFELKTKELKKENMELEANLYRINSLNNTSKIAEKLLFTQKAAPYFLDNLSVALKK